MRPIKLNTFSFFKDKSSSDDSDPECDWLFFVWTAPLMNETFSSEEFDFDSMSS